MKRVLTVIVLGGLVFSHYAFANNPGCRETVFSIQNESSNDCVLKEYKILKGTLFDEFQVPDVILRGTTMAFTVTQGREKRESMGDYRFGTNASAMVYLSYQGEISPANTVVLFFGLRLQNSGLSSMSTSLMRFARARTHSE